tara:strand:+ start:1175 stop:1348 length:174 start_codon:yes stop_codon:yes gene_type:complete
MLGLEILREQLKKNYENRPFFFGVEKYHKEKIDKFHDAIEELEEILKLNKKNDRNRK